MLLYGGRDSAKSYFAAQKVIIDTMQKKYSRYLLIRKVYADIKDSQYQTIKDIIDSWGMSDYFNFTTHPIRIVFKPNGNMILARGMDKEYKTKSIKDPTGVWYEEMNEIGFQDFLKTTTSLRGGILQEIATFNPEMETDWINSFFFPPKQSYEKKDGNFHYVKSVRDDTTILHSTYKDNVFVTPDRKKLLESLTGRIYNIYTLGLWGGVLEGLVYPEWEIVKDIPPTAELLAYGLDWGFSNSNAAIVAVYRENQILYLDELLYKTGMTNSALRKAITDLGIANQEFIADSAEPKSIEDLYQQGINIHPAIKGPDSKRKGIDKMLEYEIKVTQSSSNLIRELGNYRWMMDKNGNALNEPKKENDDALDAARYVVLNKLLWKGSRLFGVKSFKFKF